MTSLTRAAGIFETGAFATARAMRGTSGRLRLLAGGDGWALMTPEGKVVFHALGTRGRRRCLEFARAHGVLAVFS